MKSNIEKALSQFHLTTDEIDYVLMTHMHFDHAAGLSDCDGNAIFKMLCILYSKMSGMNFLVLTCEVKRHIGRRIRGLRSECYFI